MDGQTAKQFRARFNRSSPEPDVPPIGQDYWDWFFELHQARSYGEGGPAPIDFHAIEVWARLTGRSLSADEVGIIRSMDMAFLSAYSDAQKESRERQKQDDKIKGRR